MPGCLGIGRGAINGTSGWPVIGKFRRVQARRGWPRAGNVKIIPIGFTKAIGTEPAAGSAIATARIFPRRFVL